ncbi:MAG: sugar nucleotide-binding protein [Clostridiaceae bacterium]|nr:sugar nucleotide-binding protein [Clostridiaceae bacterium]
MNILVFGASGYAGSEIKRKLEEDFSDVFGTYHSSPASAEEAAFMLFHSLDDHEGLYKILRQIDPQIIIYCLRGDFEKQLEATRIMTEFLKGKENGKMIFLSTANVFDGALEEAHFENDPPRAKSEYGRFKIQSEELITSALGENGVVIRIPEVYGKECPRLQKLRSAALENRKVSSFGNVFVNYTTNRQIAEWIAYIIQNHLTGIFHIGTKDMREYIVFQKELLTELGLEPPDFEVTEMPSPLIQAVLPGREDIPQSMQICVKDVIRLMAEK